MRSQARRRAAFACALIALVFTGFSYRLIYLQVTKHPEYAALAAEKHSSRITVSARRGMISDRNGEILAANVPVSKVVIDGSLVTKPDVLANVASPFLDIPAADLARALDTKSKYTVLVPALSEEKVIALRKAMIAANQRGLFFLPGTTRVYPNGAMLGHVLGFLSRSNPSDDHLVGIEGVERSMEVYLTGEDGFRYIEHDRKGNEIVIYRGQEQAPKNGANVSLTIDMGLQAILEGEIDSATRELQPETAIGIFVNPKTGEILAMTNRPNFDLNQLNSAKPEAMKNRAIMDMVEPGSTFKIVVASGALNERKVTEKSQVYCENGSFAYGGRILRDHHGYGMMTPHEILVKSSNIGSAKMALMMGDEKFYEYVRRFGFGERTGVAMPGEISGLVHPPHKWDSLTITRMPMGHSVAVTPLQIVMSMSVIANGGKIMRPQIIRSVTNEEGKEIATFQPEDVREVIPPEVARYVGDSLAGVVGEGGTARLAKVYGHTVAGKTGTAQKVDPKGGYTPGKYVVSFVGYMPVEDPQFVCLILIDNAKLSSNLNYGGLVAAPIFSRVAERAARYLNLAPSEAPQALPVALRETEKVYRQ